MKKQVLSLLLAGALTLGLFGCSAQTPEESGVPQSAPAQTEGTDSAGVVEDRYLQGGHSTDAGLGERLLRPHELQCLLRRNLAGAG